MELIDLFNNNHFMQPQQQQAIQISITDLDHGSWSENHHGKACPKL